MLNIIQPRVCDPISASKTGCWSVFQDWGSPFFPRAVQSVISGKPCWAGLAAVLDAAFSVAGPTLQVARGGPHSPNLPTVSNNPATVSNNSRVGWPGHFRKLAQILPSFRRRFWGGPFLIHLAATAAPDRGRPSQGVGTQGQAFLGQPSQLYQFFRWSGGPYYPTLGHPSQLKSKFPMIQRSILSHFGAPLPAKTKVFDGPAVHIIPLWGTPPS